MPFAEGARSEVFELKKGGSVAGELVDRNEQGEYLVRTAEGALITFSKKQVRRVEHQKKNQLDYEKRSRLMPDTLESHRKLVQWCKQAQLSKQAEHHRRRILELDPEDEKARESLGYQKHQGRWLTRDEIMAERGLRYYDSAYRTPQDIALREREKEREASEAGWHRKIRRWRDWLNGRRSAEAAQQLAAIQDPRAAVPLAKLLKQEKDLRVRELLTSTLAELRHPLAVTTLVNLSLEDPDREVRLQCLDYLLKFHAPIHLTPYVKALKSPNNQIVNRAAEALYKIGHPAAMSPLIDALVTRHKYLKSNVPTGDLNASFSSGGGGAGGGGLSLGNKAKHVRLDQQNLNVRQALVELSGGQDFGFDKKAWRRWFVNQQTQEFVDARRDK